MKGEIMPKDYITDDQVEREIARLLGSPHVKLAMREEQLRQRRRMYMYDLRCLEKKGKKLEAEGITPEMLESGFEAEYDE